MDVIISENSFKKAVFFLLFALSLAPLAMAQNGITGIWNTIDDITGKQKSSVELSIVDNKLYGKIVNLVNPENENKTCVECNDYRKNQPILGLEIITGLENEGGEWTADDGILDPENGKVYDVKIWTEDGKLMVRGYIGFLYRTQVWVRPEKKM